MQRFIGCRRDERWGFVVIRVRLSNARNRLSLLNEGFSNFFSFASTFGVCLGNIATSKNCVSFILFAIKLVVWHWYIGTNILNLK